MSSTLALARRKLALARMLVRKRAPYWSAALHGFVYVADPQCKTMFVTESGVLGYDPTFVHREHEADLACALAHEIVHFTLGHPHRRQGREPERWNVAADLATNDLLFRAGWPVPTWFLFPDDFKLPPGLTAERYYDRLGKGELVRRAPSRGNAGEVNDEHGDASEAEEAEEPTDRLRRFAPHAPGAASCGGISGAHRDEELEKRLDREHARSEGAQRRLRRQVAIEVHGYAKRVGRGTVPADLFEWAEVELAPRPPTWEEELSAVIGASMARIRTGGTDYSMRRPSRRSFVRNLLRPGLVDWAPEVAFVVDTSGSMGVPALERAMQHAASIVLAMDLDEVWLGQADAALTEPFARASLGHLSGRVRFCGRGGTDFRPALARAHHLDPRPDLLVYFTDGVGAAPENAPDFDVVWCLIGKNVLHPAPWGHAVRVPLF